MSRVVITGIGLVTPIGIGKEAFWDSLAAGRSGVRSFDPLRGTPVPFGGLITDFDPKAHIKPRKALKVMSRDIQLGVAAAHLAVADSQLPLDSVDPSRVGVIFGAEMMYCTAEEMQGVYTNCMDGDRFDYDRWGDRSQRDMFPLWLLRLLPNMAASHVGIAINARGPTNAVLAGDASGLMSVIEASQIIQRGVADVMLAGGACNRLNLTAVAYRGVEELSHRSDEPERASRPFDANRDGAVNGEGGGVLVLESEDHARERGATILASLLGYGRGHRVSGVVQPNDAIRQSIDSALACAQLSPDDIGHVNAHGLSTIDDDRREAKAIHDVLGECPVFAPKSYFGNVGGAAGGIELAASALALEHNEVPVSLNYEARDPDCPVNVATSPIHDARPTAIALNQDPAGQCAAVIIGRD